MIDIANVYTNHYIWSYSYVIIILSYIILCYLFIYQCIMDGWLANVLMHMYRP